jgi:hypothetical protein
MLRPEFNQCFGEGSLGEVGSGRDTVVKEYTHEAMRNGSRIMGILIFCAPFTSESWTTNYTYI